MQTDNFSEKRAKIWFSPNILQIAIKKNTWKTANTVHSRTNALFDYKLTGIQNCQNESHRPPSDNLRNFGRIKCLSKRQKLQFLFSYAVTLDKFHSCPVGQYERLFFESVNLSRLVYSLNVSPRDHRFPHGVTSFGCRKQFVPNKLS